MFDTIYNTIYNLVFRFKDIIKGTNKYNLLMTINKEQYLPPPAMENIQFQRLKKILNHAYNYSPYYRRLFDSNNIDIDDINDLSTLQQIPLLSREGLQENYNQILNPEDKVVYPDSSGGSTGKPVNFFHDINYKNFSDSTNLLFLDWMGICPSDKTVIFWGSDREIKNWSNYEKRAALIDRNKFLNSFSMTNENISEFIDLMNSYRPKYIYGYASSLFLIAEFIINNNKNINFIPKAVRSAAEMLYDFQREKIEQAFSCKVFNFYGSREVNNLGSECNCHSGLHIFSSGRIIEIVNDKGECAPSGQIGHIAVTDLTNMSFPFIRYLNGDMASLSNTECKCGIRYPLLKKLYGRSTDMIKVNNQYIHGEYFTHLFYNNPEVKQFQLIQETEKTMKLIIVQQQKNINIKLIKESIINKMGNDIQLEIEITQKINLTNSGKYRFTISNLDNLKKH